MNTISVHSRISRSPDLVHTDMDGEIVMLSIERGEYYGLTGIGPFLWEQLADTVSIGELIRRVVRRYEVEQATAEADVLEFVSGMLTRNVVQYAG